MSRTEHFVHDGRVCNVLLDNLVIDAGAESEVNNVARGPDQPCSSDCFTHGMVDSSCRIFPRSVLQADTIIVSCGPANSERTSWSMQRCHKFWRLRDDLATAANYDKFLEGFEDNCRGSDGRSVWLIDCGRLNDPQRQEPEDTHWSTSEDNKVHFGIREIPRATLSSV